MKLFTGIQALFVALATCTGWQHLAMAQETCFDVMVTYVDTGGWGVIEPSGVLVWSSGSATLAPSPSARITVWSGSLVSQIGTSIMIEIWNQNWPLPDTLVHAFTATLTEGTITETNDYGETTFVATINREGCSTTHVLTAEVVVPETMCDYCPAACEAVAAGLCHAPRSLCLLTSGRRCNELASAFATVCGQLVRLAVEPEDCNNACYNIFGCPVLNND